jgi:hypothetical protein
MNTTVTKEKGILRLDGMDSRHILNLLAKKHEKDAFIPECKNGETWGARDLCKLDAWVLKRTYSPITTIGYEIKCTRADFEQDQKWTNYLDLCHEFYFVCPAGLVRAADLPSNIGIIWATKDKLHIKHKCERIKPDIEKLNRLLTYVVMSRSNIVSNMNEISKVVEESRLEFLKNSVAKASERKELAYFIKGHIRQIEEQLQLKERDLVSRENYVKNFEGKLAKFGITWNSESKDWQENSRVGNEIDLLVKRIDFNTLHNMEYISKELGHLVDTINGYRSAAMPDAKENPPRS